MHGLARVGVDVAGGVIVGALQDFVTINGHLWAVLHDPVAPHGDGLHAGPVMATASDFTTINGIPVCFESCLASCGHPSTGDDWCFISS